MLADWLLALANIWVDSFPVVAYGFISSVMATYVFFVLSRDLTWAAFKDFCCLNSVSVTLKTQLAELANLGEKL